MNGVTCRITEACLVILTQPSVRII